MSTARQHAAAAMQSGALACVLAIAMAGCGTPGAPLPPSLNLPDRVTDLAAERAGNQVTLTWTMPRRTTDKILLKDPVIVRVCWNEGTSHCVPVDEKAFAPGAAATHSETLPAGLAAGAPRPVRFYVEALNRNERSAGLSNAAPILAGEAPAPMEGLTAEVGKSGVVLHWTAGNPLDAVRLHRRLLNPPAAKKDEGLLGTPREALTQDLLVEHDSGVALDKDIRFGHSYEYRAQRVARVEADGQMRELAGALSSSVTVEAQDVFPPAIPAGLAAVATAAAEGVPASIDLSWQPDTETDVAGYRVYRREGTGEWQRISGNGLVVGPAFHDPDVQAGRTYIYAVSAVDLRGNESGRSEEAAEKVPEP
jgi:hypothetical protein